MHLLEVESGAMSQRTLVGTTVIGATCLVTHLGSLFVGGSLKDSSNIERPVVSKAITKNASELPWTYLLE